MWCIELGVSEGGGGEGGWGGGGKEVSTASHDWSKVLMGERSHPPCEGWQGNVAGGNGFSQSAETEGRSLGAAVRHGAVSLPPPPNSVATVRAKGVEIFTVSVCLFLLQRHQRSWREETVWFLFFKQTLQLQVHSYMYSFILSFPIPTSVCLGSWKMTKTKIFDCFFFFVFVYIIEYYFSLDHLSETEESS